MPGDDTRSRTRHVSKHRIKRFFIPPQMATHSALCNQLDLGTHEFQALEILFDTQQSFSIEAAVDSQLTGSLTLRIDGAVTFGSCV